MKAKVLSFGNAEDELYVKGRMTSFYVLPIGTTFIYKDKIMTKENFWTAISIIDIYGKESHSPESFEFLEASPVFVLEEDYRNIKENDNGRETVLSN